MSPLRDPRRFKYPARILGVMIIVVPPDEFQRRLELEAGTALSKTVTYFAWLDHGVARGGGPDPQVPLGLIARANEEVRAWLEYESYSSVADLLGSWGYEYDRRNVKARVCQCSGFPIESVVFWSDREPISLAGVPPDDKEFLARMTGNVVE